ncbi:MAG: hypothetical protein KAI24_09160 [Planctomycetes bacterium]|nr:hypothetical protein [Planctomycetota bacterium]
MTALRNLTRAATAALPLLLPGIVLAQAKVTRAAIEKLLQELDERFERGDVDGYLARFEPDHRGAVAMVGRHLERLVAASDRRERDSHVIAGPTEVRDRSLVRVRHSLGLEIGGKQRQLVEDSYLAVRVVDGRLVPTFAVEMPVSKGCVQGNQFKCPPCNYKIGGVDGFLCVPLPPEKSLALESASFYLIGTDVVCDVHVQVQEKVQQAAAAARRLAESFARIEPTCQVGLATAWVPPMHASAPPAGMDSARVVVKLPLDYPDDGGGRTVFHVVTFGGLQHVLLTRGSAESLRRHQTELDELFRSYMLLESDCDLAEAAARPLRHHTGGSFDGSSYHNHRYHVAFAGPEGWHPQHRVGGALFRVRWSGPKDSQLWLIGYGVPAGMEAWTRKTADRWIAHHCHKHGLLPADPQPKSCRNDWHTDKGGIAERTSVLVCRKPDSPAAPRRRVLHVQLYDDLLLIVDGFGADADAEQAVLSTLGSLRRTR